MQFLLCLSLLGVIDKYCSDQVQSLKEHQVYWAMSVFMTAKLAWRTDHESIHWLYFNKRIEYMQIVRRALRPSTDVANTNQSCNSVVRHSGSEEIFSPLSKELESFRGKGIIQNRP
jgi:hypothetical protein